MATNNDNAWVRQQVHKLRAETKYVPMEQLSEKKQKHCYEAVVHSRPQYTLDEYYAMNQHKHEPPKDTLQPMHHKKNSLEMEDVMADYAVAKRKK